MKAETISIYFICVSKVCFGFSCWSVLGWCRGTPERGTSVFYLFRASFGFRYLQYLKGAVGKLGRVSVSKRSVRTRSKLKQEDLD